jgi:hypothetical protein
MTVRRATGRVTAAKRGGPHRPGRVVAVLALVLGVISLVAAATINARTAAPPKNTWLAMGGDPLAPVLKQARRFAACVRRQGIPNLPNPKVIGGEVLVLLPPGLDRAALRVTNARRACRKLLRPPSGGSTHTEPGPSTSPAR